MTSARDARMALVAAALLGCLLGGQAIVDGRAPATVSSSPGESAARAGFAYLTGLRRFAALLIWNRLEPQFHEYYDGTPLKTQLFVLPNMRIVLLLDPRFIQAYYIAPWILIENARIQDGVELARRGVMDNPDSGLLHASLAQILVLRTSDLKGAVHQADLAMRSDQLWASGTEQWQAMQMLAGVYRTAGLKQKEADVRRVIRQIESDLGGAPGYRDPDAQF